MARLDSALQRTATKIVDAVPETDRVVHTRVVLDRERRRRRRVEDAELRSDDLDRAGGQVGVHGVVRAPFDRAANDQHELRPQMARPLVGTRARVGAEDDLDQTPPIAQVHEDDAPVVAAALNPAGHHDLAADGLLGHLHRTVRAAQAPEPVELDLGRLQAIPSPCPKHRNPRKTEGFS